MCTARSGDEGGVSSDDGGGGDGVTVSVVLKGVRTVIVKAWLV